MNRDAQIERAGAVKALYEKDLLTKANVVAVGVGLGEIGESVGEQVCIVVSVRKKLPLTELSPRDVIPGELDGVPVDVRATGEIRAL